MLFSTAKNTKLWKNTSGNVSCLRQIIILSFQEQYKVYQTSLTRHRNYKNIIEETHSSYK